MSQRKQESPVSSQKEAKIVPYTLPSRAKWNGLILVGEAPGREEAEQGKPFVGRSGKLLNETLTKANIDREACLIANVFRQRPPENKVGHFFLSRKKAAEQGAKLADEWGSFGSGWCQEIFSNDLKELSQTIEKWQPYAVIALGRTALWALTGEGTLLKNVGQTFPCRLSKTPDKIPVIPTYHPSFIMRGNWGLQDIWLTHFVTALQHVAKR